MFDIAPSEFLLVAFVALVVIGPKDLPKAMRVVGYWVGKARGVARQFRSGFDSMVREAELEEMEKRWASENERIMREHPQTDAADTAQVVHSPETETQTESDHTAEPVMVEKPVVVPAESGSSETLPTHDNEVPAKPAADHTPDLFDTHEPVAAKVHDGPAADVTDDKTGKSDVAPS